MTSTSTSYDLEKIAHELAGGMTLQDLREKQGRRAEPKPKAQAQIDAEVRYWDAVFSSEKQPAGYFMGRNVKQEMPYDEARVKLWAVMQQRAAEISLAENRPFQWQFDDAEKGIVQFLLKYFINDPTAEWKGERVNLCKGLFFFGPTGTGKTEMLHLFHRFTGIHGLSKQFQISSMSEAYRRAKIDSESDPLTAMIYLDRAFDEFGRDMGSVLRFGNQIDLNEAVIEARYERHKRYAQLSFFTANMTPNEATGLLSPMVSDRLRSMCIGIPFTGKSKRV
jgi:hypothetical protein